MQPFAFTVMLERKLPAAVIEMILAEQRRISAKLSSRLLTVRRQTDIDATGQIRVYLERSMQSVCK